MGIYTNQSTSWEQYLFFERTFLEYLRYVPLSSNNNDVWSYQLSDLIVNIGSVVDSFFRNSVSSKSLDTFQGIQTHRSNVKNLKIQEFHDIFNVQYGLSNKNVYELKNYVKLSPFDKWTHNGSPFWWTDYNKVKHNRFENRKQATLNSTLHALSALFLLNVASPELIPYLVDIGVIHRMGWGEEYLKSHIVDGSINDAKPNMHEPIHAKTELFGYIYPNKSSKFDEAEQKRILSPLNKG